MTSQFAKSVLQELNNFRANPKSIQRQIEIMRTGFSRLRGKDPFLNEIDDFLNSLANLKPMPKLEYNQVLSDAAKKQLPNWRGKPTFEKYKETSSMKGIVPDYYMVAAPGLVADDGADEAINVLTKVLLDKNDVARVGRNLLCNKTFTQVGIGHEVFEDDNMIILIFATKFVEDEPEYELPDGDLSELKKAFDCLDTSSDQKLNMKEIMNNMKEMDFEDTDPYLYDIISELADKATCSWPKFAFYCNKRMTDRRREEGLETIFNLFIDDPSKKTITFQTFKKICDEIDSGLTEQQLRDIMKASTLNGNEITFNEFKDYMLIEGDEEEPVLKSIKKGRKA